MSMYICNSCGRGIQSAEAALFGKCVQCRFGTAGGPVVQRANVGTVNPNKTVVSTPSGGLKFDSGKPRWSLLMEGCSKALAGVAAVLTFGAAKYAAHSWKQVENNKERYRDAMYRHLNAIEAGEVLDPESGLPHWDHVACNALFLSELNKETK